MAKLYLLLIVTSGLIVSSVLYNNDSKTEADRASDDTVIEETRIYEMRTYTTNEGKMDALHQRFEDHTLRLFEKHGMTNIGYWVPEDPDLAENTLIFIIAHENAEAAEKNWDEFRQDPEWQQAYEESHADGPIVKEAQSVFMTGTPYSAMK